MFNALLSGWVRDDAEVERLQSELAMPIFQSTPPPVYGQNSLLYNIVRQIRGEDNLEVQKIGDCVSWGWARLLDYMQAVEIQLDIQNNTDQNNDYGYEDTATEVIYGMSRVDIGKRKLGRGDGSVGLWAGRAVHELGDLSYHALERLLGNGAGTYSGDRAKDWGWNGIPETLKPEAFKHRVNLVTQVSNFDTAAYLLQSGYGVAVCSNVGFENGSRGQTQRDDMGFAKRSGEWGHCMCFVAVKYDQDRPGLLCVNQWPLEAFSGPLANDQPKNSFWVDQVTINQMLGQGDSWTVSGLNGYPVRKLTMQF